MAHNLKLLQLTGRTSHTSIPGICANGHVAHTSCADPSICGSEAAQTRHFDYPKGG